MTPRTALTVALGCFAVMGAFGWSGAGAWRTSLTAGSLSFAAAAIAGTVGLVFLTASPMFREGEGQ